jgi:hypothetical protein
MTEEEKQLLEKHGIKCTQKTIYHYKQYRYENLNDAIRYAEIDSQRGRENTSLHTNLKQK